jgi:hypothetical protein
MWSSNARLGDSNGAVNVAGTDVMPAATLELLGARLDRKLSFAPHFEDMARDARARAYTVSRLALYLPRGKYLRQLATGLVLGKLQHALAAVVPPRLATAAPAGPLARVQVSVNNLARTLSRTRREDKVRVRDLLDKANIPLVNKLAAVAVASLAWNAKHSSDGENGFMNPVG